ncbi:PREDICTED: nucleoside diphosphate-linked moiety X motif 19, mitochondrial-like isoform X2 [Priapulus caudatus]|nr:PREDICTED: nucleoside diphosphate-linked moiety X motif 19, mitochondrial-like isoform X2 [Priapulus caudatus]XP_014670939.1 PREDICTED: nucleoside diphosphate-linked moiety X motif 19, mitochondrial-like isoform X2 [Priapulus caudatus]
MKSVGGQEYMGSNYKVLMLKRSSKSSFMPNAHVFPGGVIDRADYSDEWLDVLDTNLFSSLTAGINGPRPPSTLYESKTGIPPDVAFRICAVRETFEETGILISRGQSSNGAPVLMKEDDIIKWRMRVTEDAAQFVRMCRAFKIVPNIWELYEWANWLTPSTDKVKRGNRRRYNTMFYIACMESIIDAFHDDKETVSSKWYAPVKGLSEHWMSNVWLAPPQFYEISRLANFPDLSELKSFAIERQKKGCTCSYPVMIELNDCVISVLKGDDLYPEEPDLHNQPVLSIDTTTSESLSSSKNLNRLEFVGMPHQCVTSNVDICGHPAIPSFLRKCRNALHSKL